MPKTSKKTEAKITFPISKIATAVQQRSVCGHSRSWLQTFNTKTVRCVSVFLPSRMLIAPSRDGNNQIISLKAPNPTDKENAPKRKLIHDCSFRTFSSKEIGRCLTFFAATQFYACKDVEPRNHTSQVFF